MPQLKFTADPTKRELSPHKSYLNSLLTPAVKVGVVRLVIRGPRDNVATAADDYHVGSIATVGDNYVEVHDNIPRGHKTALAPIPVDTNIIRYGEVIGSATADVATGQHVHVQSPISNGLPRTAR